MNIAWASQAKIKSTTWAYLLSAHVYSLEPQLDAVCYTHRMTRVDCTQQQVGLCADERTCSSRFDHALSTLTSCSKRSARRWQVCDLRLLGQTLHHCHSLPLERTACAGLQGAVAIHLKFAAVRNSETTHVAASNSASARQLQYKPNRAFCPL